MESKTEKTQKPWHSLIQEEERAFVLSKLTPENNSPRSVQLALELESNIYYKANSKAEYYAVFGEQLQKLDRGQTQKEREEVFESVKNKSPIQNQPNAQNVSTSKSQSTSTKPNPTSQEPKKEFFQYLDFSLVRYEVQRLLEATLSPWIFSGKAKDPPGCLSKSEQLLQLGIKWELLIYTKAKSRAEYFRCLAETIEKLETELKKKIPKVFEEYGRLNKQEFLKKTQPSYYGYEGYRNSSFLSCDLYRAYPAYQYSYPASYTSQAAQGSVQPAAADNGFNALIACINEHLTEDPKEAMKNGFEMINNN